VKGGGTTSQIYAIRQAIAKGMVAYYQKCKHGARRKIVNEDFQMFICLFCIIISIVNRR
jgi:small subunit ribosomal protein S16e